MYSLSYVKKNYRCWGNSVTGKWWDPEKKRYVFKTADNIRVNGKPQRVPIIGFGCEYCNSFGTNYLIYKVEGAYMCQYCAVRFLNVREFGVAAWLVYMKSVPELKFHCCFIDDRTPWQEFLFRFKDRFREVFSRWFFRFRYYISIRFIVCSTVHLVLKLPVVLILYLIAGSQEVF
jgi:hypothetical protein